MAHTLSSQQDHSQGKGYSLLYDRSPNPLSAHNSTVPTPNCSSMSCFSSSGELEFAEHVKEALSAYSSCSSSFHSVGSLSGWQLSNLNSDIHFVSPSKNAENPTALVDLAVAQLQFSHGASHVQCSSSDFTCNKLDNGGWQPFLDPSISYVSTIPSVLSASSGLALLSTESAGNAVMVEGAMLRELLGRLENTNCSSSVSAVGATTGPAKHLGSPMATGGGRWHQVDASSTLSLAVDSSDGGLSQHGTGLATSHCLAEFSSDPGVATCAARFSSFPNITQLCQSLSSSATGNMNPIPEASHFPDKSRTKNVSMTFCCPTLQSSPTLCCNMNARNNLPPDENIIKAESLHDIVQKGPTAAENDDDTMRYRSTGFLSEVAMDETKSLRNGSSPTNSSGSGQCTAMQGLMTDKGLIDTQEKKRQNSTLEVKAKEVSCLSESSKKKMDEAKFKRQRTLEGSSLKEEPKSKVEKSSSENSGNLSPRSVKENHKPREPPKQDYIHVRARRGQATDSHSLAERVRREKISERMKFLQELVPGCSKVTGKALMLDEIINYVQSLQRQVEVLSMKLAAVNPRLDLNIESLLTKEMLSSFFPTPMSSSNPDNAADDLQLHPTQQNAIQLGLSRGLDLRSSDYTVETALQRSMVFPISVDTYANFGSQTSGIWDGELQSIVQMSFGSGSLPSGRMKVEL
ncbi:hypothetical protein O6H91_03G055900 [Diphasiastrum complanatum]|uniref:Uncharacterized protein n=5 Tax=Diphasiastrum complanatum TaxID=34168 RepID=A0ACC2E6Y2_DIPCM|nr:hypothetical protein O6H91_03G055900 [Diphasiastrum complanatum]KAJ7562129.1 hypothetical protein O6H91_03G055900 [Diphasiastrum complanatum]KAJ7562132.1 hypothetical protein O6H91_03G055900 [Diphasiastrum complanatum]KAJ7562134.1 hypothetical protein O6H91_03G055900 [Diphasiastrum complanatum]KAJ7562135.1 hypothetical protein O6H91_03G055900 [Diphasiastrum complanatum]